MAEKKVSVCAGSGFQLMDFVHWTFCTAWMHWETLCFVQNRVVIRHKTYQF